MPPRIDLSYRASPASPACSRSSKGFGLSGPRIALRFGQIILTSELRQVTIHPGAAIEFPKTFIYRKTPPPRLSFIPQQPRQDYPHALIVLTTWATPIGSPPSSPLLTKLLLPDRSWPSLLRLPLMGNPPTLLQPAGIPITNAAHLCVVPSPLHPRFRPLPKSSLPGLYALGMEMLSAITQLIFRHGTCHKTFGLAFPANFSRA